LENSHLGKYEDHRIEIKIKLKVLSCEDGKLIELTLYYVFAMGAEP
jgi:hypothetical protein